MTDATPTELPAENVQRGTVFALAIVPAGIIVWVLIWSIGFVASIVGFAVAYGAVFLYRLGAGGRIGRSGAIRIAIITIVTMLLAFAAGVYADGVVVYSDATGTGWFESLASPDFWSFMSLILAEPEVLSSYALPFLIALGLSALGCFSVLRAAFSSASAETPAVYEYPITPAAPTTQPTVDDAAPGLDTRPFDAPEEPKR